MRDYASSRAAAIDSASPATFVGRLIANWKDRRRIASLAHYDDHMLRDIGVSRADLAWAASLPLTVNASLALEQRAFARQRKAAS
jgi:uncharacterized protein YjiS (DUF1127 family)